MYRYFILLLCLVLVSCGSKRRAPDPIPTITPQPAHPHIPHYPPRFGDADPWEWESIKPTAYPVHGIDISRWQGDIDWITAKRAGVSFAFIKATEGGDVADPKYWTHHQGAKRAGVPYGAYHYYYFCRSAAEQARWFIQNVPRDYGALPHVLDMEWTPTSRTCTKRPDGRTVRAEAKVFLDMLQAHYGKRPIIYTTPDFYRETGIGTMRGETFWLRSVAGHPSKVYPGARWTFWQYTGTGLIPGIPGEVDINVFRGSHSDWVAWRQQ